MSESTANHETLTPEIFKHLVQLAAFALEEEEAEYLRTELNHQLKAIRELAAIEVPEGIGATSHGVAYTPESSPPLRKDEIVPCSDAEDILNAAPEVDLGYIVVPDIPHEELE